MDTSLAMSHQINAIYRQESRRVLATLIRLLRDFDLAEEALHDAFIAALAQWPATGIPNNPRASPESVFADCRFPRSVRVRKSSRR